MTGLDISAYTGQADAVGDAITAAAPTLLGGAALVAAGMIAFNLGVRVIRRFAK